ncbi:MAG: type I-U CRISPR-associated protein Csb2 [Pseudomonadota bacterium]|nr:type I-U CRISPR-associated protein Csb2 [Pseudomonadota bacterium]
MFGLGIRYLMGWAMAAADGAKKERAEWPPHPDRVFMALAAAWFETGKDVAEGEALHWLESLDAPEIAASGANLREVTTSFVPVNDSSNPIMVKYVKKVRTEKPFAQMGSVPIGRDRQPRAFPVAIPHNSSVHLIWHDAFAERHRHPLASLCRKVTAIGHPASLVQMWLAETPPAPNLAPRAGVAKHRLRVFGPGRLAYLEARCNREAVIVHGDLEARIRAAKGRENTMLKKELKERFPHGRPVSLRPEPGLWQGYDVPGPVGETKPHGSVFDPRLLVLALSGKRLPLQATLKLTEALRGALLSACPEPIPEWVSGHTHHGQPSSKPHAALLPLPFVGAEHADGRLMGLAVALPRDLDPTEAARVLEPWLRDKHGQPCRICLFDGQWLECGAELDTREAPPFNLRSDTWTRASRRWATVTPVVLDRHFDGADKWERGAEVVKDSCERVGLPRPVEVLLHPVSLCEGVPKSNEFPWISRKKDGGRMHHTHAAIVFEEAIQGPVIVGAGRFRGYGLCRPMLQGGESHV